MVTKKWSHLYIIRALADASPSEIPVWGQMRGCLECHSVFSYPNTAVDQVLGQTVETPLCKSKSISYRVAAGQGRGWSRTDGWASSPKLPALCYQHLVLQLAQSTYLPQCVCVGWGGWSPLIRSCSGEEGERWRSHLFISLQGSPWQRHAQDRKKKTAVLEVVVIQGDPVVCRSPGPLA